MSNVSATIPMKHIGPMAVWLGMEQCESLKVPMATFETTLWPSVNRGAKITRLIDGVRTHCLSAQMTRSIIFTAPLFYIYLLVFS